MPSPRESPVALMNREPKSERPAIGSVKKWFHSLWRELPLWIFPCLILSLLYIELAVIDPSRFDLALSGLAPLFWFLVMLFVRSRRFPSPARSVGGNLLRLLIISLVIVVPYLFPPVTKNPGTVRILLELNLLLSVPILALHCLKRRSAGELLSIFGVGFLYGMVLENSGIAMGFFREPGYLVYLPRLPAPLCTMGGWITSFYVAVWAAESIAPKFSWPLKTLLATAIVLSLDMQIDPAAVVFQWWLWPESFSHRFLGVPLINFIAWVSAVIPFYGAYYLICSKEGGGAGRRVPIRLLMALPVVLFIAAAMVMALTSIVLGFGSPEMKLFLDVVVKTARILIGR